MFKSDSTRVACLWIPRFPIVVAQRPGNAPSQPAALIQGEGSHACLVHVNEAAHRQGIREGWRLSRARALSPHGRWIPWDEVVDQRLMEVTQRLSEALSQVAPRLDASGHGCFWLEPFIPRGEPDLASGEEAFATRVLEAIHVEGFAHGRVGVANGVITAYAAACHGGASVSRVAPGDEIRFLGRLPCSALPMSPRTLGLLEGVGVTRISALQALDSSSLIARFGREGEKLYALARGLDHRAPRTPPEREASSVHVPLAAPCQTIEPLVFVIRGALDRLLSDQARRGLAIGRVRVWLHREVSSPSPGAEEPWQIEVAPSRPTTRVCATTREFLRGAP